MKGVDASEMKRKCRPKGLAQNLCNPWSYADFAPDWRRAIYTNLRKG